MYSSPCHLDKINAREYSLYFIDLYYTSLTVHVIDVLSLFFIFFFFKFNRLFFCMYDS